MRLAGVTCNYRSLLLLRYVHTNLSNSNSKPKHVAWYTHLTRKTDLKNVIYLGNGCFISLKLSRGSSQYLLRLPISLTNV
jgi:hypothetical protein